MLQENRHYEEPAFVFCAREGVQRVQVISVDGPARVAQGPVIQCRSRVGYDRGQPQSLGNPVPGYGQYGWDFVRESLVPLGPDVGLREEGEDYVGTLPLRF